MTTYIAIGAVALLIIGLIVLNWEWVKSWWASVDPETRLQLAQRAVEELVLMAERVYPEAGQGMSKHAIVKGQILSRFPGLPEAVVDLLIDGAVKAMNRVKVKHNVLG